MNENDKRILKLKDQIAIKKSKLKKIKRFSPITNCSLELDGIRYNIQVLTKNQLIHLFIKLNAYKISAKELDILDDYTISGFSLNDWINDIKAKIDIFTYKNEEKLLKSMENKLHTLLTERKKVELEIDEIEKILK